MIAAPIHTHARSLAVLLLAGASLAACATPHPRYSSRADGPGAARAQPPTSAGRYKVGDPYQVAGVWYVPREQPHYDETGVASWYGDQFHMQPTANGETFDMNAISAAHTTLPLPSIVEVTNLDNGRRIQVRVNDRGPFVAGRVIDLSHAAAQELGYDRQGLARVRVRYVGPATLDLPGAGVRYAANGPPRAAYPIRQAASVAAAVPAIAAATPLPAYSPPIPRAPVAVSSAPLAPITGSELPALRAESPAQTPGLGTASAGSLYRVQAGAFSDHDNARRVAAQLGDAGRASIEPVDRNGITLYRVMLPGSADEGEAWVLRDRVASLGYVDARVIRPF